MNYPEKIIYTELVARLKANAHVFTLATHVAPVHYDWDRNQYEPAEELTEFPFARPAIFIRFGEMDFEATTGKGKRGTIPVTVLVVQNKYVDARDGAANQTAYLKLLEYKYLVNQVLDGYRGSCFSGLELVQVSTDHDNRNLHVERLSYTLKAMLIRTALPDPPPPPPPPAP